MSFRLVPKLVTLNDLERHNGPYFELFQQIVVYDVLLIFIAYLAVSKSTFNSL